MDREEFFRLKKVQGKKKRDTAQRELEEKAKREAAEAVESGDPQEEEEVTESLIKEKDDDGQLLSRRRLGKIERNKLTTSSRAVIF